MLTSLTYNRENLPIDLWSSSMASQTKRMLSSKSPRSTLSSKLFIVQNNRKKMRQTRLDVWVTTTLFLAQKMSPSICFHLHKPMETLLKRCDCNLLSLFSDSELQYLGFYSETSRPSFRPNSWVWLWRWHTWVLFTWWSQQYPHSQQCNLPPLDSSNQLHHIWYSLWLWHNQPPAHIHLSWLHPQRLSLTQLLILFGMVWSLVYSTQRYSILGVILAAYCGGQWTSFGSDGQVSSLIIRLDTGKPDYPRLALSRIQTNMHSNF